MGNWRTVFIAATCSAEDLPKLQEAIRWSQEERERALLEDRFWEKVDRRGPDECWEWTAARMDNGYGVVGRGGRSGMLLAHRASWMIHHGPIPEGMLVCHRCDVQPCVNPDHLFLGTQTDNLLDASRKGRMPRGERHPHTTLIEPQVLEIYRRAQAGENQKVLAREFRVCQPTISHINTGKRWGWLTGHHPKPQSNASPPPSQ